MLCAFCRDIRVIPIVKGGQEFWGVVWTFCYIAKCPRHNGPIMHFVRRYCVSGIPETTGNDRLYVLFKTPGHWTSGLDNTCKVASDIIRVVGVILSKFQENATPQNSWPPLNRVNRKIRGVDFSDGK